MYLFCQFDRGNFWLKVWNFNGTSTTKSTGMYFSLLHILNSCFRLNFSQGSKFFVQLLYVHANGATVSITAFAYLHDIYIYSLDNTTTVNFLCISLNRHSMWVHRDVHIFFESQIIRIRKTEVILKLFHQVFEETFWLKLGNISCQES